MMLSFILGCRNTGSIQIPQFGSWKYAETCGVSTMHRKYVGFHNVTGTPKLTKKCDMKNMCKTN